MHQAERVTVEQTHAGRPVRQGLDQYLPYLVCMLLVLFAGGLYVRTLAPSVMPGDYAEFQFCAAILGVPHPTGYPLYILLGKLFTLLPFGDMAYRVNFSSAVYMAGAVGLLYAVAVRLLRLAGLSRLWWCAAVGAALFAVAPTVWSMSLVARSYALNALLVGSVIFCLISWRNTGRLGWFLASCTLIGLSMVHHGTTYLLLPAYGLYLLLAEVERSRHKEDRRPWLRRAFGVAAFALGFSPLLFLVYRFVFGSPYYWGNPTTWKDFFSLITGGPFHNQVMAFGTDLGTQLGRIAFGIGELSGQYTPVGIALGLGGLIALWRLRWAEAGLLTLMMLGNFLFAMNYSLVGYLYFIPTYLIWGVFMSFGVGWLLYLLLGAGTRKSSALLMRTGATAFGVVMVLVVGSLVNTRFAGLDLSEQTQVRDQTLAMLNAAAPNASLYLDWEELSAVRFYRLVYGMRTDLALHSGDPDSWPKNVYCDVTAGTPTYVGKFAGAVPAGVTSDFELEPASIGWRVARVVNPRLYEVPPCGLCATCR
ncbi:MAG: DUF2723 domain-containing protein [Chloroflexota bacterium]|nr:DUF2723 domain-containing protein [Chloroflexota bacterium]